MGKVETGAADTAQNSPQDIGDGDLGGGLHSL